MSLVHRMLVTMVVAAMAVTMTACGDGGSTAATTTSVPVTNAPVTTVETVVAATPPMGWNSWNQVRCDGLNERVVKQAADALVQHGLDRLGYHYVVVDDCWQAPSRDGNGSLVADPTRFPSGLQSLVDYVHNRGLKFGLYLAPGSETCAMHWDDYPARGIGSFGHERQDAEMLDRLGIDYLKYDWCRADETDGLDYQPTFTLMRNELDRLEHPIVYSISDYGNSKPWTWAPAVANLWRTTSDIAPLWPFITFIIENQADLYSYSGPGHWNDPDMLQVGNGALSVEEARTHVAMWAMLAAPLMVGTNLDDLSPDLLDALSNPEIIAIDQDALGQQAQRLGAGDHEIWVRNLDDGDFAVALLNKTETPATIETSVAVINATLDGIDAPTGAWTVRDASARTDRPATTGAIAATVAPHAVTILRLSPA